MLKNYLIVGWRNLVRAAGFSVINIFGLAAGMGVALLIGLWVYDEISFNKLFPNHDRISQIYHYITLGEEEMGTSGVGYPYGAALKSSFAEFENVCMAANEEDHILGHDELKITDKGRYVDPSFLDIFSVNMVQGSHDALKELRSIVLSRSLAEKLFSDEPIGKMLKFDNKDQLMVTGVFEDFPSNSAFVSVKMLVSIDYMFTSNPEQWEGRDKWKGRDQWDSYMFDCFALLSPDASVNKLNAKIENLLFEHSSNDAKVMKPKGFLFPMNDWHLHINFNDGVKTPPRIRFVWLFGVIGAFVLTLACINFMNLNTARSEKRSKEVGVRKVMGSVRKQLIHQFFGESLMVVMISAFIAVMAAWLALPAFNELTAKKIELPWSQVMFYFFILGFVLITALLAGSYPALYLSSFNPVQVLKGTFKPGKRATIPRKVMVVFQFTISILLIIGTAVVFLEIQHERNRPVGFDLAGIVQMEVHTDGLADADYNSLRNELLSSGAVQNMAKSDAPVTGNMAADATISWEGKDPDLHPLIAMNWCSHDFPATNGFQFVEGRDFSRDFVTDSSAAIVNELTAELIGKGSVLGAKIKTSSGKERTIVGVIKDQIRWTPFSKQSPHIYFVNYDFDRKGSITMRLNASMTTAEALKKIQEVIRRIDSNAPFEYHFQDERYARLFDNEERMGKLAAVFAGLAIAISCVGIFGLAAFAASQRIKEIGIRKVLGASSFKLWSMLSLEFIWLVLLSIVIAFPIAYYLSQQWLSQYEYRVDVSWSVFALTGLLALVISLLTVSYQALRAALMNPVNCLRND